MEAAIVDVTNPAASEGFLSTFLVVQFTGFILIGLVYRLMAVSRFDPANCLDWLLPNFGPKTDPPPFQGRGGVDAPADAGGVITTVGGDAGCAGGDGGGSCGH